MGWKDYHLHQFLVGDVRFAESDEEFLTGPIDYRAIALNQIEPRTGTTCVYEYDFGDGLRARGAGPEDIPAGGSTLSDVAQAYCRYRASSASS